MENILNFKFDPLEKELFIDHSFDALKTLVNDGRELEFRLGEHICFLSKYDTSKAFSLWVDEDELAFDSFEELLERAKIDGMSLLEAWPKAKIKTLY